MLFQIFESHNLTIFSMSPIYFVSIIFDKIVLVINKTFYKFQAEGLQFTICLRSLEQFIGTVKAQNNLYLVTLNFSDIIHKSKQLKCHLEQIIGKVRKVVLNRAIFKYL